MRAWVIAGLVSTLLCTIFMGLAFLIAEGGAQFIAAAAMIVIGVWMLARGFLRRERAAPSEPPPTEDFVMTDEPAELPPIDELAMPDEPAEPSPPDEPGEPLTE